MQPETQVAQSIVPLFNYLLSYFFLFLYVYIHLQLYLYLYILHLTIYFFRYVSTVCINSLM